MVVVGGITRLTESGLSITEWKPISGAIPPLTQADWQHAFDLYQQTPQYREVAGPAGMTLSGFKFIFFWEWVHRLLGRILGLVFFVGVGWFALKRAIPRAIGWRLAALFVLGGLQGAVGWFMVMSGLEGRTEVSPYRLSAHLLFALFLFRRSDLDRARPARLAKDPSPARLTGWGALALGDLVRPADARRLGRGLPRRLCLEHLAGHERPFRPARHRLVARRRLRDDPRSFPAPLHAPLVGVGRRRRARPVRPPGAKGRRRARRLDRHPSAFGTQIILGILTVLSGIAIWLAVLHQATGALLVAATVWGAHELGQPARMSVISVYAVFADAEEAERIGRAVSRSGSPPASTSSARSARSTAGKARSRPPTRSRRIFKTTEARRDALITRIAALHSYDVPCIVTWPIEKILAPYADWVEASVD